MLEPTPTPSLRGAGSPSPGWLVNWLSSSLRLLQSSTQRLSVSLHSWSNPHATPVAVELRQQPMQDGQPMWLRSEHGTEAKAKQVVPWQEFPQDAGGAEGGCEGGGVEGGCEGGGVEGGGAEGGCEGGGVEGGAEGGCGLTAPARLGAAATSASSNRARAGPMRSRFAPPARGAT